MKSGAPLAAAFFPRSDSAHRMQALDLFAPEALQVAPGAYYFPGWLTPAEQAALVDACRFWGRGPAGFVVPRMFDGTPLSIRSAYLGWYWHRDRYSRYADGAGQVPVQPFPPLLDTLARRAHAATFGADDGYAPDSAIVNWYGPGAKLGMHQDRGESAAAIARGWPVISISLGDSALFRFGNTETRTRPYADITLSSGDLFVFGGPARMAYHGVPKVYPGSGPRRLALPGRLNITIRQSGF